MGRVNKGDYKWDMQVSAKVFRIREDGNFSAAERGLCVGGRETLCKKRKMEFQGGGHVPMSPATLASRPEKTILHSAKPGAVGVHS